MKHWLKQQPLDPQSLQVMEATGVDWEKSAHWLYEQGAQRSVGNPASVKYFAKSELRRGKTDKMDAQLLAVYGHKLHPKVWQPERETVETLRQLTRARRAGATTHGTKQSPARSE